MDYTLNDFNYQVKRNKLIRVNCKHCQKQVGFSLPKGGRLQDVMLHTIHDCLEYRHPTPPVSNAGMYFAGLEAKADKLPITKAKSRWMALRLLNSIRNRFGSR